jgi:hypothetical protein
MSILLTGAFLPQLAVDAFYVSLPMQSESGPALDGGHGLSLAEHITAGRRF